MAKGKRAEARCRYLVRNIAAQKGWNTRHPQKNGDFLEEQEIEDFFPDCGLCGAKPDFLVCQNALPVLVVEAKNDIKKIGVALAEAKEYADAINAAGKYKVKAAVGVAGEEDHGYLFKTEFWDGETVFLDADARYAHVSSSLVRELISLGQDVSALLPDGLAQDITRALSKN